MQFVEQLREPPTLSAFIFTWHFCAHSLRSGCNKACCASSNKFVKLRFPHGPKAFTQNCCLFYTPYSWTWLWASRFPFPQQSLLPPVTYFFIFALTMTLVYKHPKSPREVNITWKHFTESSNIGSSFFSLSLWYGLGGGDVHWRPVCVLWCADVTPHRLWSCVLAGRDNYTAVWDKVSTEADSSFRQLRTMSGHPSRKAKSPNRQRTMTDFDPAVQLCKSLQPYYAIIYLDEKWMRAQRECI